VCGGEEKAKNTCAHSLASLGRGKARRWARAHDVRVNSPPKSVSKHRRPTASFCHLFLLSPCLIHFDRDRASRLWDAVTLGRSSLYICAVATEIATNQQPRKHQHIKVSPLLLLRRRGYFIPFVGVHLRLGEKVFKTAVLSDPAPGEGE
jgi:hypothetical protein